MNLEFQHLLPQEFSPNSRVWIYQSSRLFSLSEALEVEDSLQQFVTQWASHGSDVQAYGNLFFGQFVILMADESTTAVSGCSTDSSVRFIKNLGEQYSVDFFNRINLAFVLKDKIQTLPFSQLTYALQNNFITTDTLFFDNTVPTKEQLEQKWIIPIKDSWLAQKLKLQPQQ